MRLTPDARKDLKQIGRYTLKNWGKTQFVTYMNELRKFTDTLSEKPQSKGKSRNDFQKGLRSLSFKKDYFIFYRIQRETVEIIRILHQRRNWQNLMD